MNLSSRTTLRPKGPTRRPPATILRRRGRRERPHELRLADRIIGVYTYVASVYGGPRMLKVEL